MRHIQYFKTAAEEQAAIDAGQLGKPYVVYIQDGQYIDWNTKGKSHEGQLKVVYISNGGGSITLYNNKSGFVSAEFEDGTKIEPLPDNRTGIAGLKPNTLYPIYFTLADPTVAGGDDTFWVINEIREVVIPEGVITIPTKFLMYTGRITSLSIPSSVTTIGGRAFNRISYSDGYDTIKEVHIPAGVTNIGGSCFADNTKLDCVVFEGTVPPTIGSFQVFDGSFTIYVPDASVTAYKTASNWSNYADRIKGISEKPA